MRGRCNDELRLLIGVVLQSAGVLAKVLHRARTRHLRLLWSTLRRSSGIFPETELTTAVPPLAPASGST